MDLFGFRFGKLVVASQKCWLEGDIPIWRCLCDCGNYSNVRQMHLRSGHTTSCGCAHKDAMKHVATKFQPTHGLTNSKEFNTWQRMKQRCNDVNCKSYPDYGGRGITICGRWASFEDFLADMGNAPSPQHSIDRIDNSGNYEPSNCRWATAVEQNRNKRSTLTLTIDGQSKPLIEWAAVNGIAYTTVYARIKRGMDPVLAVTLPLNDRISKGWSTRRK